MLCQIVQDALNLPYKGLLHPQPTVQGHRIQFIAFKRLTVPSKERSFQHLPLASGQCPMRFWVCQSPALTDKKRFQMERMSAPFSRNKI